MKTAADDRRRAVQIATRANDACDWAAVDPVEVELLCAVLIDCRDTFVLYAPVVDAAKRLVAPRGACVTDWQQPWTDLMAAVQALRKVTR